MQLSIAEREALSLLSDQYGATTGDLAQQMPSMRLWSYSRSVQSQNALTILRRLQARGLVKHMDAERPIVWMRVKEPTASATPPVLQPQAGSAEAHPHASK